MTPASPNATPLSMNSAFYMQPSGAGVREWETEAPSATSTLPASPGRNISRWFMSFFMVAATSLTPIVVKAGPQAPVLEGRQPTVERVRASLDRIRQMTGATEEETAKLLGLKGGRHTLRKWRKGDGLPSPKNYRRLLAVGEMLDQVSRFVPDLKTFLFTPTYTSGPTPFDLIQAGRDRAVLGLAKRQTHRVPRVQDRPRLRELEDGPIAYTDRGGD